MGELQAIRIQEKVNPYLQLTVKRYVVLCYIFYLYLLMILSSYTRQIWFNGGEKMDKSMSMCRKFYEDPW